MTGTRTYETWKAEVDQWLSRLCGLVSDDLPDWGYADAYEDGVPPKTVARRVMRAADDEF